MELGPADRPPGAVVAAQVEALRERSRRNPLRWLFDAHSGEREARAALHGQIEVGRQLQKLGPGWFVMHSVPVSSDLIVDHMVMGPPGVFTLTTLNLSAARVKVTPTALRANRRMIRCIRPARHEAHRVSGLLSAAFGDVVVVRPVLVVLARELTVVGQPDEVHVVARRDVARWLIAEPEQQPHEVSVALAELAAEATTWSDA